MNNEVSVNKAINSTSTVHKIIRSLNGNMSKIFYLSICALIIYGWKNKEFSNITPETGYGYWLGIIGGSLILFLLLYPLRKKVRFFNMFGKVKTWFKLHMLFGVLGPVAILFHANFSLGSTNGNVAFFSMVVVASSGFVGRYLYAKIHHGLYGRKANLKELREAIRESKSKIGGHFKLTQNVVRKIKASEKLLLRNRNILWATLVWPIIFIRTEITKSSLSRTLKKSFSSVSKEKGWDKEMVNSLYREANNEVQPYIEGLYNMYGFRIFEGLFSLWHLLHYPLFIMLLITGVIHVVVVHSY